MRRRFSKAASLIGQRPRQYHRLAALVHGSKLGYMIRVQCPRRGAIIHEVPEAESIQAREGSISGAELG